MIYPECSILLKGKQITRNQLWR